MDRRLLLAAILSVASLLGWAALARHLAPSGTAGAGRVDALIVLGTPADADGNPQPAMLDRIDEAVAEYERGVATRILFSGGAAHNRFVEADVMARVAQAQGVPQEAIYRERASEDTIQNLCNSLAIARAHGWRSVEVISSPAHLFRVRMMLADARGIAWRVHAAPEIDTETYYRELAPAVELWKTVHYLVWSRWRESCPASTALAVSSALSATIWPSRICRMRSATAAASRLCVIIRMV